MQRRLYWESYYIFVCECKKECRADEHLENYTCMKSLVDNLVITCDDILNALINFIDKKTSLMDYCFLLTILLVIVCLL